MTLAPQATATATVTRPGRRVWLVGLFCLRVGLAAVFLGAAVPKLLEPDLFASNIYNYQILPPWGVNALAIGLPWLELVVGVCLLLGLWTRASALLVSMLMVIFVIAFTSAKSRGLNISCGCFEVGQEHGGSPLLWVLFRDFAFLAAALLLVRYPKAPSLLSLLRLRS